MLTRKRDAIRTVVAALAVPFPPIPTLAAYFTMPGVAILNGHLPAKGVPVALAALPARMTFEELPEWDGFT